MSSRKHSSYRIFRCEVDLYRNGAVFRPYNRRLYARQTEGLYYVCAKNPRHAARLLQTAIGFGQIHVPARQCLPDDLPDIPKGGIVKYARGQVPPYTDRIPHASDAAHAAI